MGNPMNQGTVTVVSHDLTVPGNHKVMVSDFLTISEGSAFVVARMDAEFDFSTIPAKWHALVINNLVSNRIHLSVWSPYGDQPVLTRHEPPSSPATALARQHAKKWWQFWRNL
jgi:hypothetical protein